MECIFFLTPRILFVGYLLYLLNAFSLRFFYTFQIGTSTSKMLGRPRPDNSKNPINNIAFAPLSLDSSPDCRVHGCNGRSSTISSYLSTEKKHETVPPSFCFPSKTQRDLACRPEEPAIPPEARSAMTDECTDFRPHPNQRLG